MRNEGRRSLFRLTRLLQENHEEAQDLVISNTELKQVVYAFKCNKSTLQVKGKLNSITLGEHKTSRRASRSTTSQVTSGFIIFRRRLVFPDCL